MMRSSAYNRFGVLMGTSSRASCPRWLSLRGDSLPMITLISSQGDFCATAADPCLLRQHLDLHPRSAIVVELGKVFVSGFRVPIRLFIFRDHLFKIVCVRDPSHG